MYDIVIISKSKPTYFDNSSPSKKEVLNGSLKIMLEIILNSNGVHVLCHCPIWKERRSLSIWLVLDIELKGQGDPIFSFTKIYVGFFMKASSVN